MVFGGFAFGFGGSSNISLVLSNNSITTALKPQEKVPCDNMA